MGSGTSFAYDLSGSRTRICTEGGTTQELQYDVRGNIVGVVDGNQNRTQYHLDSWGRIVGIIKADGSTEFYSYDFAGNMTSSTDGENRMIQKTDRNGVTVEFGYNLYGAPLFRKEKNGTLGDFYEYTPEGLVQCAISAGMRYNYTYDVMGRVVEKSASGRALLAMVYDQNGNKVRQTDVTGKVTEYTYSPMDLLTTVCDDGGELAAYDYNPDGTVKALVHGPIRQDYTYDLDKNLVGLKVQSAGELLADNLYQYDGNGNRTRKQQLGGDTYYHYDPLNQLQRVEYPGYIEELFYDKAGNRTRRIAQGVEELYRYDPRNRLTFLTKGGVTTSFQYDNAGNLLADDKAQYSYDAFNRTIRAELFDGNVQVNRYDAEGLRYEMEENGNLVQFIFNIDREAVTEEDSTGLTRLIRSTELIARSTDAVRTYYHYASDEMGSTTHIVDENGNVQNRYEYDAWGNITVQEEAIPNRFKYTGQQLDPITQQYYLRARFYNPVIARFTQEDTYRGDGLNLYAYCANNPVYYVDPSGYVAQNFAPQDYAEFFRMDFGVALTEDDARDIALMLYDDLINRKLTHIDGVPMNSADRRRALDVAANLNSGRIYWGLSGATEKNPTRYGNSLPVAIQNLVDPTFNPDILRVTQIDENGRRVLIDGKQTPGDCAEFSTITHIYNDGEYIGDYKHFSVLRSNPNEISDACDICAVSSTNNQKIDEIIYGKQTTNIEQKRQFVNPKAGCP